MLQIKNRIGLTSFIYCTRGKALNSYQGKYKTMAELNGNELDFHVADIFRMKGLIVRVPLIIIKDFRHSPVLRR
ncbi:MAG: hypothetical protein NMNS01_30890 [Nitrosomonas sp.]|nr:MAG: hypothetical protein NMNS01_30890 [Nitrosomonas sp.]